MTLLDLIIAATCRIEDFREAAAAGAAVAVGFVATQPDAVERPRDWWQWFRQSTELLESIAVKPQ